jgi:hypothetical protein
MNLTAKEMFEALGYKHEYQNKAFGRVGNYYEWKQPCSGALKELMFYEIGKELSIRNETDYGFSGNEIEAITQQMKELGWIE